MGYRDDREALRQRAEGLSQELEAARRELEAARARAEAHESKDVEDERRIEALEKKLAKLEGRSLPPKGEQPAAEGPVSRGFISVVLVLMAVAGGVAVVMEGNASKRAPSTAAPARPAAAPPSLPPEPARSARVTVRAKVKAAEGINLAPGTACEMWVELVAEGASRDLKDVVVRCGPQLLYKRGEHDGQAIVSTSRWDFEEAPAGPEGGHHYRVLFEDRGERSSRLFQISVDTRERRMRLWRDEPSRAGIDLEVEEWSAPRGGEPLVRVAR